MKTRKILCFAGLLFLMVIMATSANAASVTSQLFFFEENLGSDNSAEYLLNWNPPAGPLGPFYTSDDGDTIIDGPVPSTRPGDILRGWFEISTVEDLTGGGGSNNLGDGTGNNELSGIFEGEVISKTNRVDGGDGIIGINPATGLSDDLYDYVFGPTAGFQATYGPGAMIATFEDPTPDYQRTFDAVAPFPGPDDPVGFVGPPPGNIFGTGQEEALLSTASDGTNYWTFGFTGDPDEGWVALGAPEDIGFAAAVPPPAQPAGSINIALNLIPFPVFLNTGPKLDDVASTFGGFVQMNGSGNLIGLGASNTPANIFDNFDFVVKPVPEPATMLLFGSGLIGLARAGRRKFFHKKG